MGIEIRINMGVGSLNSMAENGWIRDGFGLNGA